MYNPIATYRIQFHKDFSFRDFEHIITYLQKLGVGTVYASPILASVSGSTHGYDGIDPQLINPELGSEEDFGRIAKLLKTMGIGWLQDIVPNHMAFDMANKWIWDVLEKGRASQYAKFFDIDWDIDGTNSKLMVPFLNEPIEVLIQNGAVKVGYLDGRRVLECNGINYPLNESSLALMDNINTINGDPELITKIVDQQYYKLCYWRDTETRINYRRFFTINGLICLNVQDKLVFDYCHSLIEELVDKGFIDGLRIDHIDGLYDPGKYLEDLRELTGNDTYITVEKILEPGEALMLDWPIQGTTGYDFLAIVNNLFVNRDAKGKLESFYKEFTGEVKDLEQLIYEKKSFILYEHMRGELSNLFLLFKRSDLVTQDELEKAGDSNLRHIIGEFLVTCPVYRYYSGVLPLDETEKDAIKVIFDKIRATNTQLITAVNLLEEVIIERPQRRDVHYNKRAAHFYKKCMQFTGPLMAKGVEDTLMYSYNCFIGNNDVGDASGRFGCTTEEFHRFMIKRQENWPLSLNTTSTHDTKRGEDSRARLAVITDISDSWIESVKQWHKVNNDSVTIGAPDINDEYFIYQALFGVYPMVDKQDDLQKRMHAYLEKALREAKRHTSWASPDTEYESRTKAFLSSLLKPKSLFLKSFSELFTKTVDHGILNSLSQLVLKFTCPGIPDIYQGAELWDLSLVDPDNRRPVNYKVRSELLQSIEENADIKALWEERYTGKIKLWLTKLLLVERQKFKDVFTTGSYLPLVTKGKFKNNVLAFARFHGRQWYISVMPLHTASICPAENPLQIDWGDTGVVIPEYAPGKWKGLMNGHICTSITEIRLSEHFSHLPLEVFTSINSNDTDRGAGILAAISSLPSKYGIGDIGPSAYNFARFLHRSLQSYWQLLPLNPISAGTGYSPYSSISSMAGNVLLISPELLVKAGLLDEEDLVIEDSESAYAVDYKKAETIKNEFVKKAYGNYQAGTFKTLRRQFYDFCDTEKYWLDDFALFAVCKEEFGYAPWYEWPEDYKYRNAKILTDFADKKSTLIDRVKWLQFIFFSQWKNFKEYCNGLGIDLFGDIPFYVSYDSADVWSNSEIFSLDAAGNLKGIAGVPPDYFSKDGQLWGMPTFNWKKLKDTNYDWWVRRLKRNMELYDLIRLDHFRAFAEYWEVPQGEKTAKNGKWLPGPGKEFFEVIERELGGLPFVAEDLGDNMEKVYALRTEIDLPGMKVLQFAFSADMAQSVDIPHNYSRNCIVYTGTHDNNTTLGWFKNEIGEMGRKRIEDYVGYRVTSADIHKIMVRLAYSSVGKTVIIPLQDILGLDDTHRMNAPGSGSGNWLWRFNEEQLTSQMEQRLRIWVKTFNRHSNL